MAEIKRITVEGINIDPYTVTDAVTYSQLGFRVTEFISEFNVSNLYPTQGIEGSDKYNILDAITLLKSKLPESEQIPGTKITFLNETNKIQTFIFNGDGEFEKTESWVEFAKNTENNMEVVQETGTSTANVMSQNSVTLELDKKVDKLTVDNIKIPENIFMYVDCVPSSVIICSSPKERVIKDFNDIDSNKKLSLRNNYLTISFDYSLIEFLPIASSQFIGFDFRVTYIDSTYSKIEANDYLEGTQFGTKSYTFKIEDKEIRDIISITPSLIIAQASSGTAEVSNVRFNISKKDWGWSENPKSLEILMPLTNDQQKLAKNNLGIVELEVKSELGDSIVAVVNQNTITTELGNKANVGDSYTKEESNAALDFKLDKLTFESEALKLTEQSLTDEQKTQVKTNLSIESYNIVQVTGNDPNIVMSQKSVSEELSKKLSQESFDNESVKFTNQELTPEQKEQVRRNIGTEIVQELGNDPNIIVSQDALTRILDELETRINEKLSKL